MRGVTDEQLELLKVENISTHTPHARRDHRSRKIWQTLTISTHTPHARRDNTGGR